MSTFKKIYKKIANNGNSNDYQEVGTVGVNGVNLDIMRGANSSSAGEIGLVPKPSAGDNNRYLRSDGTWSVPPDNNTTYSVFNGSNDGLVPSTNKGTYFLTGNGTWGYPWIGSWIEDGKAIICLGSGDDQLSKINIPEATQVENGLMSATDKLIHDLYSNCLILFGYIDVQIGVGTVNNNATKYFNHHFEQKIYKNKTPKYYDILENVISGNLRLSYEPSFMGCSFGGVDNLSNGADSTVNRGSDSNGDFIVFDGYVKGNVRNHAQGDHSLTVLTRVDVYVSANKEKTIQ